MSRYGVKAHPLDNPIWETLHTHHARFASGDRGAFANERAKTLYDRLGFADRSAIPYWVVRRSTAPPSGRE